MHMLAGSKEFLLFRPNQIKNLHYESVPEIRYDDSSNGPGARASLSLSPSHMPCASSIWPSKSCLSSLLVVHEVALGVLGINDIHGLVDPTQPNLERFPDYKKAHGLRCHVRQVTSTRTFCHFFCRHFRRHFRRSF